MGRKLSREEYADPRPARMARFFLGKKLCVQTPAGYVEGIIWETEAYGGARDGACHAHLNRRTARTEIMFAPGGVAYVYLCYGLHFLFNIITGPAGSPEAVLVRAVKITSGHELAKQRRDHLPEKLWANGPGKLCAALGIGREHQGCDLTGNVIWIEEVGIKVPARRVRRTPRIGIDYAGEVWAAKPWRFVWDLEPVSAAGKKSTSRRRGRGGIGAGKDDGEGDRGGSMG